VFCLVGAFGAWGCDQAGGPAPTPTGPTVETAAASGGPSPSSPAGKGNKPPVDVDPVLFAILDEALQDEHHAYYTYSRVLLEFADQSKLTPFTNIVNAEDQHVKAASHLFDKRGWEPLPSTWTLENVPTFGTFIDACRGGADAERANIAMYDRLLANELPEDVVKVFETLKAASLNNHLPAFEKCVDKAK
jgi:rubrerythrin